MDILKKWTGIFLIFLATCPLTISAEPLTEEDVNTRMADKWNIEETTCEYIEVKAICTFYTSLAVCNGSANAGKNAIGGYLSSTSIAIPRNSMPFGTTIEIDGIGTRIADDVGSQKYIKILDDGSYRFDIYMPRLKNENDKMYKQRIMEMGVVTTTAKIYYTGGN